MGKHAWSAKTTSPELHGVSKSLGIEIPELSHRLHKHMFGIRAVYNRGIHGICPEQHNPFFPHETCQTLLDLEAKITDTLH